LFCPDLASLRDDIAVLTFNYDPYLSYLARKAYVVPNQVTGRKPDSVIEDALTSGLRLKQPESLDAASGLAILQLPGSTAFPNKSRG
jgi:hypothetical protein